jgi:NodT family efflux transporter outer membrane factor (OMF) lipoprotein
MAGAGLAGCEVGPNYHRPQEKVQQATWVSPPTTQASVTVQEPIQVEQWWTTFNDPTLNTLIKRAALQNLDIQSAAERIRQARATVGVATAGFFPTVNSAGSYSRSFSAAGGSTVVVTNSGVGTGTTTGGTSTTTSTKRVGPKPQDFFQAGFDASWELDVFGGVRRSIEAANYTLEATEEDRRDVMITVMGEVATDYIALRGFQQEIAIAQENLSTQVSNADIARKKQQLGTTTQLDIANADAEVFTTRSQIATFVSSEQQEIYALGVLLGQEPTTLLDELSPVGKIPIAPPVVPVGLPSELLRRRPDIRRAERQLAAATAEVGVAVAQLFPQFSLTGSLTLQGNRFEALSNWGNRFWSFGPSVTWPVFDAGRIWSNIEIEKSLRSQAYLTYRSTVLAALQDVETQLTAYAQEQQRRAALADAVAANQKAVEIATKRYQQGGLTDFLNVLVAEQSLFATQDALVQSNRNVGTDLVALYKALGGGWQIGEPSTTQPVK